MGPQAGKKDCENKPFMVVNDCEDHASIGIYCEFPKSLIFLCFSSTGSLVWILCACLNKMLHRTKKVDGTTY